MEVGLAARKIAVELVYIHLRSILEKAINRTKNICLKQWLAFCSIEAGLTSF
jgi:hypothetical protein